jgi:serine/threonine protein kinase
VTLLRPDLPPGLVRIIERAMAKQPDQRYSDLDAMVNALEDELMQPTPPPRLLTPFAGVPAIALRDPASGEHAVQAILKKELSEQHQETRVLFAFPPEGDSRRRTSHAKPVPTDPRPSLRKVVLAGSRPLSAPRFWNGLLGAGFAVALGFFAVWMIIGSATRAQTRAPSPAANAAPLATEPASKTAIPAIVSNATAVSVAFPAPSAASPSPPEMDTPVPVKPSKPTSHAHAMRASGTSAKSAALRASRLTRADF